MDFTIGRVAPADIAVLLGLIRELACFERLEVEATEEALEDAFFGQQPVAGALLAKTGTETVGYAIYFFTFSSFLGRPGIWLEDLYVRPAHRKQGLGKALIQAVGRVGVQRNCGRFEWTALNWNKTALEFYENLGAQVMDEWCLLRLSGQALHRVAADASQSLL